MLMIVVLIGGLAVVMFALHASRRQSVPPVVAISPIRRDEPSLHIEGEGCFEQEVVGEGHYQEALNAICGGKCPDGHELEVRASLVPEPDNPYDRHAVAIFVQGRKVGHLPRDDARAWTRRLTDRGVPGRVYTCDAIIVGGWKRERRDGSLSEGSYGIALDISAIDG